MLWENFQILYIIRVWTNLCDIQKVLNPSVSRKKSKVGNAQLAFEQNVLTHFLAIDFQTENLFNADEVWKSIIEKHKNINDFAMAAAKLNSVHFNAQF